VSRVVVDVAGVRPRGTAVRSRRAKSKRGATTRAACACGVCRGNRIDRERRRLLAADASIGEVTRLRERRVGVYTRVDPAPVMSQPARGGLPNTKGRALRMSTNVSGA